MDLSDLQHSLGARDVHARFADPSEPQDDGGLVAEIMGRHGRSIQPESKQICLILNAVLEVIKAEGLQPTPTALFAALLASLGQPAARDSNEVTAAMCRVMAAVLDRVPNGVLRLRFTSASKLLVSVLETRGSDGALARAVLPCLCQVLAALNPADWPAAARPFALVLDTCLDARPKLRKKAQAGLVDVLACLQTAPVALLPASEAVLKVCQRVLPAPEAAARAAAAASSKKRQDAETAITRAVADALHLLGLLKQSIFLLAAAPAASTATLVVQLYPLRQALLSKHATDVLVALCASSASHLSPRALGELLGSVLDGEDAWDRRDADAALGTAHLLEQGLLRLHQLDAGAAAALLPRAVHALVPQLASEHEGVRLGTSAALRNLIAACIDADVVAAAVAAGDGGRQPSAVQRVVAAVESSLGAQYRDAWEGCLPVASELLDRLGMRGSTLAGGLVDRIGQLCAGGEDAAEAGDSAEASDRLLLAAQTALGGAMRSLGPEAVLSVLPLNIEEGLDGRGEARAWLLPLMRMHVRGARLAFWVEELLPLARILGSRAAAAEKVAARKKEAQVCSTLEGQLWALLPAFCSWAEDVEEALPMVSAPMAAAFQKRAEFQPIICNALQRLAAQTRLALRAAGTPVGYADPTGIRDDEPTAGEEEDVHAELPAGFSAEAAQGTLRALRSIAPTWLALLLRTFLSASSNQRTHLEAAIAANACVCDAGPVAGLFEQAQKNLFKAVEQDRTGEMGPKPVIVGGDNDTQRRCTFLEASLALAGGLDVICADILFKSALTGMAEKEPALQKKSYKVVAYLCESRPDFLQPHFQDVLAVLLEGSGTAVSAAKRYRLRCLKAVILELARPDGPAVELAELPGVAAPMSDDEDSAEEGPTKGEVARIVMAPMVSEIILCVKETNKRTRATAYELLVDVARAVHEAEPPPPPVLFLNQEGPAAAADATPAGGLHALFSMVLGGLVGSTPHMVSASVMALARLLYEFAPVLAGVVPDLMPAVLMLLRSKAREVIKSVLGFLKVVCMRLPTEDLRTFVPAILEGTLLWAEDSKNKFRLKVRIILERLARRCGFEALEPHFPESHRALLTHIRKQTTRKERKRSEADSQMEWDGEEEDARTQARTTRTAARSKWASDVFSEDEEDKDERGSRGGRTALTAKTAKSARTAARRTDAGKTARTTAGAAASGRRLPSGGEPLDLLDVSTSRRMVRAAAAGGGRRRGGEADEDDVEFPSGAGGRMIIRDEEGAGKRKRSAAEDHGMDSDDSDFEDLKGFSGLGLALKGSKSVALAPSIAASLAGKSLGGRTAGAASHRSRGARSAPGGQQAQQRRGSHHSGDRFKAKGKGAGGDARGSAGVEPYAYWPLDRKLMNRRQDKKRQAKQGLDRIVAAAKDGAAKGAKAKRARK